MKTNFNNKKSKVNNNKQMSMFHLAWPIFIESILIMLVGNVDQYMIAGYSENAVGAIGNANQIINLLLIMFNIISVATTILVSQYIGAKNTEKLSTIYTLSIGINLVLSVVIALIISLFSTQIFTFMSLPNEIFDDAVVYIRIVGGFIFLQGIMGTFSAIFRANKLMKENMIVSVVVNVFNVVFNAMFIYGIGPIPSMGVAGAAIGTNISRVAGVILFIILFVKKFDSKISFKYLKPFPKAELKKMLSVGIPSATESVSFSLAMTMITKIVNMFGAVHGTYIINTRVLARTFSWFSFLYASAIGQASQVVIGNHMGAGETDEVDRVVKRTLRNSIFFGIIISLTMFIFSDTLFGLFSTDPRVLELGKKVMFIEIILEIGKCTNITLVRSLQATGDVRFPTVVGIVSMWAIAVGGGYLLGVVGELGLVGVWMAMAMDEDIRGIIFYIRWRKGGWRNIRLVEKKSD